MSAYIGTPMGAVVLELYNTQVRGKKMTACIQEDQRQHRNAILLYLATQGIVTDVDRRVNTEMTAKELAILLDEPPYVLTEKGKGLGEILAKAADKAKKVTG